MRVACRIRPDAVSRRYPGFAGSVPQRVWRIATAIAKPGRPIGRTLRRKGEAHPSLRRAVPGWHPGRNAQRMARILLVHGDLVMGEALAREVETCGHDVGRAPTARAAAALAEDGGFDLLLADLQSLGVDGAADLGALARARPSTKILLLTSDRPDLRPRQRPWAAGHLVRPFTRDRLCATLHAMIENPTFVTPLRR